MRQSGFRISCITAAGLAALLAGCGSPVSSPQPSAVETSPTPPASSPASVPASTPETSPSASATQFPSPDSTPAPASGWTSYTTPDGDLAFDHPTAWTITDRSDESTSDGAFVEVAGNNKTIATLRTNMVTGAECTEEQPYSVMDSEPLPALAQDGSTPRFTFEGRMDPADPAAGNVMGYGITSAPEPTGPTACPMFHFFTWPPSGAAFAGIYDPMLPVGEPHVDTPQAYMETQEYQDIRKMITSLRPAG